MQCQNCGEYAGAEHWRRYCSYCFKEMKRKQEAEKDERIEQLEYENRLLRMQQTVRPVNGALPSERVRELLSLCHPDKHGGSPLATKVTQWLLTLKR